MVALTTGSDSNVKVWNSGPSGVGAAWQNYQIGTNSNPVQSSTQTTVTAMSWSGGTVTLTATAHGLTGSLAITVTGVTPSGYNGIYSGTVFDANTITFPLTTNPGAVTVQGKVQAQEYWGAEAQAIANYRTKYPSAKIAIYKQGPGGAQLYDGSDIPSWNSRHTVATTSHWDTFKLWYVAATGAAAAAGVNVTTAKKVVFWRQGETEANTTSGSTTKAGAYQTDLTNFAADTASQVINYDAFVVHQLFGTTTGNAATLYTAYPYCDTVRAAHAAVATSLGAKGRLVDDASAWTVVTGSNIHYLPSSIDGVNGTGARMYALFALPDVTTAQSIAGTAQVGQTLTYTPAVWNYTPTSAVYQWNAGGTAISGATALTYSPQASDVGKVLTVTETVTVRLGTTATTSAATSAVLAAPAENAATTALVNAAVAAGGTAPSSGRRAAVDALISGLITDGVWSKIVALEVLAGHDQTFASMEWKNPAKTVAVFAGSPTYTVDSGWALDGTSQSLTSGLNPTTLALAQNQVGWGLWIAAGTGGTSACGISGSVNNRFNINRTGGGVSGGCSAATTLLRGATGAAARASNHYLQRNASVSTIDYYVNGAADTLGISQTSAAVQTADLLLGQNGTTPTYVADRYWAMYFTNGALTSTDISNLHTRLATYKTAVGA